MRRVVVLSVALAALLAGCAGGVTLGEGGSATTVTPAPVPTAETPDGPPPPGTAVRTAGNERYLGVRPTCERPPGEVVHLQVMALANDERDPHEGINTTYQFSDPAAPNATDPPEHVVRYISNFYAPLLVADEVVYGPVRRAGDNASRDVTVRSESLTVTYNWSLERQPSGRLEGCWLTTTVIMADRSARGTD